MGYGVDADTAATIANEIASVRDQTGVEMAVVVGGGNIWRGEQHAGAGMDRAQAVHGHAGALINALPCRRPRTSRSTHKGADRHPHGADRRALHPAGRAIRHLEKGRIVIFGAGTGNPFFTTDTAAALRAVEVEAEALLKGTHSGTDGIYTSDPRTDPDAVKLDQISYIDLVSGGLRAMDATAATLCMENNLPIVMFDLMQAGNVLSVIEGRPIGTIVA